MPAQPDPVRIGRYHVVERVGRGAMGTVYRAHDPQIGRTVAIKVLHVDDEDLRRRFQREVQSAGTLNHPNIVTIHDYGEDGHQPFIVMEYVEGRTLADVLRDREPLSLTQKLHLVEQLCSALDYAHDHGIVHRDIKPANLMIGRDGRLHVVDFGIARVGDGELTRTGALIGTLKYMAPEQIDGAAIDRRTDIFSVGTVLYELLSLQQAFQGETPSRVMRAILHEQPPALTQLCSGIAPELVRVVERALRKEPSERYATLRELAHDLNGIQARLAGDPGTGTFVIDRSNRPAPQPLPPAARSGTTAADRAPFGVNRAWLTVGLPVAAATVVVAVLALVLASRPTPESSVAPSEAAPSSALPASESAAVPPARVPDARPTEAPGDTTPALPDRAAPTERRAGVPEEPEGRRQGAADRDLRPGRAGGEITGRGIGAPKLTPYEEAKVLLSAGTDPSSQLKAAGLLQGACDGGEVRSCFALAQLFDRTTGVGRDLPRAAALYERACEGGNGTGCYRAGILHRDGDGAVRNLSESLKWLQRACDAGTREGCFHLGLAYARGTAVARDESRAASLYQQACDADLPMACDALGRAYQDARGVAQDSARARSLFQKACDAGGMPACVDLGLMVGRGAGGIQDEARAVALFQRGCDAGVPVGCGNLAGAYARGRGVPRDDSRAAALYQQACDGGGAPSCAALATAYGTGRGVARDEARAIQLLHRACDGNVADSCRVLSQRYEQGNGVERNTARAAELMRRAQQLSGGRIGATPPPAEAGVPSGVAGGISGGIGQPPPPPPPKPVAPIRIGGAIKQPVQTKKVEPVYPPIAQQSRVQGVVIVEIVIGPQGKVTDAKVLRSVPMLDQAALDAVRQWEYAPTVVDGTPVPVLATVTVNFSLQPPGGRGRGRR